MSNMSHKSKEMISALFRAYARLAEAARIDKIRVTDIADEAGIHRATFYRYLEDSDDLLRRGTDILWDGILERMEETRLEHPAQSQDSVTPEYIKRLFKSIMENSNIFRAFITNQSPNYFQQVIRKKISNFVEENRLFKVKDSLKRKHLATMIGSSLYATLEILTAETENSSIVDNYFSFVKYGVSGFALDPANLGTSDIRKNQPDENCN